MMLAALGVAPRKTSPTLGVNPNPPAVGGSFTIFGAGFQPNAGTRSPQLIVQFYWPGTAGEAVTSVRTDANGSFFITEDAYWAGTYTVTVNERENDNKPLASVSFTVAP